MVYVNLRSPLEFKEKGEKEKKKSENLHRSWTTNKIDSFAYIHKFGMTTELSFLSDWQKAK